MPASPLWLERIPDVLVTLGASNPSWIDRRTLQDLLGIGKTEAWTLLRRWGATTVGSSLALERQALRKVLLDLRSSSVQKERAGRADEGPAAPRRLLKAKHASAGG